MALVGDRELDTAAVLVRNTARDEGPVLKGPDELGHMRPLYDEFLTEDVLADPRIVRDGPQHRKLAGLYVAIAVLPKVAFIDFHLGKAQQETDVRG
ncbi:hypothetical protein GCM10011385_16990 [Nitratireductor aestuarii]|uniref:Uncharacterized protein n=1 Tax=Nitratireductor aestuarii TaxID=1735103 RepID=A0A916RPE1_9HYPH|nr:hypothetical protein GCM10011385_16990 [Nitratireductor aestuarii]